MLAFRRATGSPATRTNKRRTPVAIGRIRDADGLQATADVDFSSGKVKIHFTNSGKVAVVFQVRSGNDGDGPWTYTVGAGDDLADRWNFRASHETAYDLTVYGPNGFMRAFKGGLTGHGKANVAVQTVYEPRHVPGGRALHLSPGAPRSRAWPRS